MIPVVILQHPKERRSKCTLEPLRGRPGFTFHTLRPGRTFDASGLLLLSPFAPPLQPSDAGPPILLLDSTWHLLPQLERGLLGQPLRRALPPGLHTAYPRRSKLHRDDPAQGLASIEALYAALRFLGHDHPDLLSAYPWRDLFLAQFDSVSH